MVKWAYLRWLLTQGRPDCENGDSESGWLVKIPELHDRRAPGHTCVSGLQEKPWGTLRATNDSKGCGGLMRVAPVGLMDVRDPYEVGCSTAAITHGHPTGQVAAGFLALLIAQLLEGEGIPTALAAALERTKGEPETRETIEAVEGALQAHANGVVSPEAVESLGGGWVAEEALAISLYCALSAPTDFAEAVRLAVNHSGDSDSTGAITGNILGAHLGHEAIPRQWLDRLELGAVIEMVGHDLYSSRSDPHWSDRRYPGN